MSKFSNPRSKYSTQKKPPKKPISFRLEQYLYNQVYAISSGDMTAFYEDAIIEKLFRDLEHNKAVEEKTKNAPKRLMIGGELRAKEQQN